MPQTTGKGPEEAPVHSKVVLGGGEPVEKQGMGWGRNLGIIWVFEALCIMIPGFFIASLLPWHFPPLHSAPGLALSPREQNKAKPSSQSLHQGTPRTF